MGFDSTTNPVPAVHDGSKAVVTNDQNQEGTLHKLQLAAGLQDNYFATKVVEAGDQVKKVWDGMVEPIDMKPWFKEAKPPSDKERADAEKTLEGRTSKLIPEADRQVMKEMTTALTNGDAKAFAEACKKAGGNPEKLKNMIQEVDKMLEEKNCSTRLDVTADGKVLVHDALGSTALSFDSKTGAIEAKSVEHNIDGSLLVKPGELLHVDTNKLFHGMGDSAVNDINGKGLGRITIKEDPIWGPMHPLSPRHPWKDEPIIIDEDPRFKPVHPLFPSDKPWFLKLDTNTNKDNLK